MNRMVEYQAQYGGLGLNEMITALINATWKAPRRKGVESLVQVQTEQVLLTYLLFGSIDDNNSFVTNATILKDITDLKAFIEMKKKSPADNMYTGHLLLALERMKQPEKAKPTIHAAIPPGAPIGCDEEE